MDPMGRNALPPGIAAVGAGTPIPEPAPGVDLGTRFNGPAKGTMDRFIRRFNVASHLLAVLALYAVAATAIGAALAPALWFMDYWRKWSAGLHGWIQWPALGTGYGLAFFIAGFALLLVVPVYNLLLPTRVKPFKGSCFSMASVPWLLHNGLFYLSTGRDAHDGAIAGRSAPAQCSSSSAASGAMDQRHEPSRVDTRLISGRPRRAFCATRVC